MKATAQPAAKLRLVLLLFAMISAALLTLSVVTADAHAALWRLDDWGATNVRTDPDTTTLLFSAGIIPLPMAPTTVTPTVDAARYRNPITGGRLDSKTLAGKIRHSGGILLARRNADNTWTSLSLERFTIRIDGTPDLTALVAGTVRVPIATLDLSAARITTVREHGHIYLKIANVGVTLNKTATDAIEATFFGGDDVLPDEVKLGTARVFARTI
ncbi:MAG: hypothetical protein JW767_02055 [Thermoleophilia bacterium]|nr:hypothetical protein [Thermoleophilia bacterium]